MTLPHPAVIIFIGPPGAGKGTQANLFVENHGGYRHFDTGRAIEKALADPKRQNDPEVRLERERFEKGYLTGSHFKMQIITDGVKQIAHEGLGIILSGSPRTREEAEFIIPFLASIYGEGQTAIINIEVPPEVSIGRNSRRRICKKCGQPLISTPENDAMDFCPVCGGELIRRVLDKEDIIEKRLVEYLRHTKEIVPFAVAIGVPVLEVAGEGTPEEIHERVNEKIQSIAS
ncbi:MAG: nucleoside monophosphate kinase [Patescibacteria group bacterium]|mgnify:CR=1 FL=1